MPLFDLQNRFDFFYSYSDKAYEFTTDDNVKYIITFLEYSSVMDVPFPVYSFIIDRSPDNQKSKDLNNKIRNTILEILNKFFESDNSALVTIYDSVDGKQMCRKRLFDRWYDLFNDGSISKKDGKFKADGQETYAVAIYSSDHEHSNLINSKFNDLLSNNFYN